MTHTVNQIRETFTGFFEKNGHEHVSSSPLVPQNDPSLMFVNSGMVQFKNLFTGAEKRDYTRATTAQKCVRAGGKHNDLDNVGYTARHHTFFEMLGNFSFGDYFKEQAISYAWELVSKHFDMPKDRLLVTVHSTDEEAATLWKKIAGFSDDKIIRIDSDDNFWQMGDTGPCGPCTEIFFDQGDKLEGGPPGSPEEDGDRYLEFWNLVFMQFEQFNDGRERISLPKPCVDTGMGLERMAALLQGKDSNYGIDMMRALIEESAQISNTDPDGEFEASHRVICDHLRSSAFLIADGVLPSNEGRGYVVRRIMRRAMRHVHLLGYQDPMMYQLVPALIKEMGETYDELNVAEKLIIETLKHEEIRFKKTVDRGLHLLKEETNKLGNNQPLPGDVAFQLYDTYGFPLDLTQDVLRSEGREVDVKGFKAAMAEQKKKARAAWSGSGDAATETIWFDLADKLPATEFLGYTSEKSSGEVLAIIKDGKEVKSASKSDKVVIITNQTPFYGESGGQVGDTGTLSNEEGFKAKVTDTKKAVGKLFLHHAEIQGGEIKLTDGLDMEVDHHRRTAIRANHSATHLLHEALRQKLGEHVTQKGSLQDPQRTRFDISQPVAITAEELAEIEQHVNDEIRANTEVSTRLMPLEEARASGAMALFGEKYDDEVRVVSMGTQKAGANKPYSVELCGGTHVKRTGDIGLFKIISEGAVSAGIRRIEAVTAHNALAYFEEQEKILDTLSQNLKVTPSELVKRVDTLTQERKKMEQEIANLRKQLATGGSSANDDIKELQGTKFIGKILEDFPAKDLKSMADELKSKIGSGIIALVSTNEGKASLVVAVTQDCVDKVNAVDLVNVGAVVVGGKKGGGRPDMAQAGGPSPEKASEAIEAIENFILEKSA